MENNLTTEFLDLNKCKGIHAVDSICCDSRGKNCKHSTTIQNRTTKEVVIICNFNIK